MKLGYYTTSVLHLSLEDYHNAGLTSEQTKEIIESMSDPGFSNIRLRCTPGGVNSNWNVTTVLTHPEDLSTLVQSIEYHLDSALDSDTLWPAELNHLSR